MRNEDGNANVKTGEKSQIARVPVTLANKTGQLSPMKQRRANIRHLAIFPRKAKAPASR
jgi:hypothetical protein